MLQNRHILDNKKQELYQSVQEMARLTEVSLREALECLASHDPEREQAVIEKDRAINKFHEVTDHLSVFVIASQQPVAHDLREIVAAMWIGCELERIGDYAANIARIRLEMNRADLSDLHLADVRQIGNDVIGMLNTVMQAFSELDVSMAESMEVHETRIDEAIRPVTQKFFETMKQDSGTIEDASRMLWIMHTLERVADRATNIAEQVVYAVTAQDEHLNV